MEIVTAPVVPFDLDDIQGNLLRGYRPACARHFLLVLDNPAAASAFLGAIAPGSGSGLPTVTTAARWADGRPSYFLNVGLTCAGLRALGLPTGTIDAFPTAFRDGPVRIERQGPPGPFQRSIDIAATMGETGPNDPSAWRFGGPRNKAIHIVLSLYAGQGEKDGRAPSEAADNQAALGRASADLRAAFAKYNLEEIDAIDGVGLPGGVTHFGFRDGIGQPRILGSPELRPPDHANDDVNQGDFLLGKGYVNFRRGNFLGDLPPALADNGTYGALRMMSQDVPAFDAFLDDAAHRLQVDRELVAAKLMGRWKNGTPLSLSPRAPKRVDEAELNRFDFVSTDGKNRDDESGAVCPVGSHIRRLNPRGSRVIGVINTRRIVRRGMSYDHSGERGLIGYFLCGDLELQYEFIIATWGQSDFSRTGLTGTTDPIIGNGGGKFVIQTADPRVPIVLDNVPRLSTTRGAAYTFIPGIGGLRYLATRAWEPTT